MKKFTFKDTVDKKTCTIIALTYADAAKHMSKLSSIPVKLLKEEKVVLPMVVHNDILSF